MNGIIKKLPASIRRARDDSGNTLNVALKQPQIESRNRDGGTMNAEEILNRLMEGNKRYVAGKLTVHDVKKRRESTLQGQKPVATIVACSDSRVKPDLIFDTNMETIFDIQTAGNVLSDLGIGSIEYGVAHAHTPVVMILGHEKCGAVTAAYDKHREGNITAIIKKIEPVIESVERTENKDSDITKCAAANVKAVMKELMDKSEIVRKAVESGEVKLVGAMYYLTDGHVELIADGREMLQGYLF